MSRPLAIIGFMGAGKTTVAAQLSARLGVALIDIDENIEVATGMSVAEIFTHHGQPFFRKLESELLEDALGVAQPVLLSCGGGIVLDPHNAKLLKERAFVVYLQVSAREMLRRIEDASTRPLLMGIDEPEELAEMIAAREMLYEAVADLCVDTDDLAVDEVCERILTALKEGEHGLFHT